LAPLAADSEEIIKYRKAVMKSQAGHMGAVAKIVLGKVDFRDDLLYHARALDRKPADDPVERGPLD
jgi:hypothetical protein